MDLTQTVSTDLVATLTPVVERRQELKAQITLLEAQVDGCNDEIKNALINAGESKAVIAGFSVTLDVEAKKSTLDKLRLLEQGVTTDQIKAATKETEYIRLDVRKTKETA